MLFLKPETTARAQITKVGARAHVLYLKIESKMRFELVFNCRIHNKVLEGKLKGSSSTAHSWWFDTPWARGWRSIFSFTDLYRASKVPEVRPEQPPHFFRGVATGPEDARTFRKPGAQTWHIIQI